MWPSFTKQFLQFDEFSLEARSLVITTANWHRDQARDLNPKTKKGEIWIDSCYMTFRSTMLSLSILKPCSLETRNFWPRFRRLDKVCKDQSWSRRRRFVMILTFGTNPWPNCFFEKNVNSIEQVLWQGNFPRWSNIISTVWPRKYLSVKSSKECLPYWLCNQLRV